MDQSQSRVASVPIIKKPTPKENHHQKVTPGFTSTIRPTFHVFFTVNRAVLRWVFGYYLPFNLPPWRVIAISFRGRQSKCSLFCRVAITPNCYFSRPVVICGAIIALLFYGIQIRSALRLLIHLFPAQHNAVYLTKTHCVIMNILYCICPI